MILVKHSDIVGYFFRHCGFLLCKHTCISSVWLENFGRGR